MFKHFALGFMCTVAFSFASCANTSDETSSLLVESSSSRFTGQENMPISYVTLVPPKPQGAVLLIPGYTESHHHYAEMKEDFTSRGYAVYIMDLRGMGTSGRSVDNPQIVHIEKFSYYVDDVETFLDQIVLPDLKRHSIPVGREGSLNLFAQSTGGLIGAHLLTRRPQLFRAAVLASPAMQISTGSWPKPVAYGLVASAVKLGFGKSYASGYSDFDPKTWSFADNLLTNSRQRFAMTQNLLIAKPELVQGGPSNQWVKSMLDESAHASEIGQKVSTPVIVFQAGDDQYVRPEAQKLFCDAAAHCRIVHYPTARHEIIRELNFIRDEMLRETFSHFGDNGSRQ